MNDSEFHTYLNIYAKAKATLGRKFRALSVCVYVCVFTYQRAKYIEDK